MPPEYAPHAATWLSWPHNPETWPGSLPAAEDEFGVFVEALVDCEPVHVLVQDEAHRERVAKRAPSGVALHVVPSDDSWMRDIGPTFVHDDAGGLTAIDFTFNSWGGKYPPWDRDDAVAAAVAELAHVRSLRPGMVLEGGSLEVDGEGTLLATRSSLIDERRNPGVEEAVLSRRLGELLGVRAIIWLDGALEGDDTDGHIDNLARFVAPGRVVCGAEESPSDANHAALARAGAKLRRAVDAAGRRLEVIDLPMPPAVANRDGRLPASHLNFYIANRAVLVPTFGGESDDRALATLRELFPERAVVGVPSRTLVAGLGTLHCLSQQQPAV